MIFTSWKAMAYLYYFAKWEVWSLSCRIVKCCYTVVFTCQIKNPNKSNFSSGIFAYKIKGTVHKFDAYFFVKWRSVTWTLGIMLACIGYSSGWLGSLTEYETVTSTAKVRLDMPVRVSLRLAAFPCLSSLYNSIFNNYFCRTASIFCNLIMTYSYIWYLAFN